MGNQKKTTSKAYPVRLSANAVENIDEITGYIAFLDQRPLSAVKVGDAIFETIARIQKNPFAFKECEELKTKSRIYRRAACLSWSIIYKVLPSGILILGIIHSACRPAKLKTLRSVK